MSSTQPFDVVYLICTVANTTSNGCVELIEPDMDIGTPTAGVLTNCSDLPLSGLSGASNSAVSVETCIKLYPFVLR